MELKILKINGIKIAELISDNIEITTVQSALDIMADADYREARVVIIQRQNICPDFFDLKTGLAGEILQKFANYRMRLAITGDLSNYKTKSFKAFITECNRGKSIFFSPDRETAIQKITG